MQDFGWEQPVDEAAVRERVVRRVYRRMQIRRKVLVVGGVVAAIGILAAMLGRSIPGVWLMFAAISALLLLLLGIDVYRLFEQEWQEAAMQREVDREMEKEWARIRARAKLKRDVFYRLSDDGELVEADPSELDDDSPRKRRDSR